jgi:hypothetical protein
MLLTKQPALKETVRWLQAAGLPALPIAPVQSATKYPLKKDGKVVVGLDGKALPRYTGKNPSWLDSKGVPQPLYHTKYQNKVPTAGEVQRWFANSKNGVGTLGFVLPDGRHFVPIDWDAKNFDSQEESDRVFGEWLEKYPVLKSAWLERTQGGGWHVYVAVVEKPAFTNFAFEPGGKHIGEAMPVGRFCAMSPTMGPSGRAYETVQNFGVLIEVPTLDSIGLYARRSENKSAAVFDGVVTQSDAPNAIALERLGSQKSKDILNGVDTESDRSATLTAAANEWISWMNWCSANGIPTTGDPIVLTVTAGERMGVDAGRATRIAKSARWNSASPACTFGGGEEAAWKKVKHLVPELFQEKCPADIRTSLSAPSTVPYDPPSRNGTPVAGGNGNGNGSGGSNGSGGGDNGNGGNGNGGGDRRIHTLEEVSQCIDALVKRHLNEGQAIKEVLDIAERSARNPQTLLQMYRVRCDLREVDRDMFVDSSEIAKLYQYADQHVELKDVLPSDLAESMDFRAKRMGISPVMLLQYLLPSAASMIGGRTNLIVQEGATDNNHWKEPAVIWALIIEESGGGKSRAESAMLQPIKDRQKLADERYERAREEYAQATSRKRKKGEDGDGDGDVPTAPRRRNYKFDIAQIESVLKGLSQQPKNAGTLWAKDEFAGIIRGLGQYKSRGGDDVEVMLGLWDANQISVNRMDEDRTFAIHNPRLSMAGGLQPGVAKKVFEDPDDDNGKRARFLIAAPKSEVAYRDYKENRQDKKDALHEVLNRIFNGLESFPQQDVRLTDESDRRLVQFHNVLAELRFREKRQAIRNFIAKLKAYVCRLALVLHCMECAADPSKDNLLLQLPTLERSILLCKYYLRQNLLMQARADESGEPTSLAFRIQEYAESFAGGVTMREIYRKISTLQRMAKESGVSVGDLTLSILKQLQESGRGRIEENDRGIVTYFAQNATDVPAPPDAPPPEPVEDVSPVEESPLCDETIDIQNQTEDDIGTGTQTSESGYGFTVGDRAAIDISALHLDEAKEILDEIAETGFSASVGMTGVIVGFQDGLNAILFQPDIVGAPVLELEPLILKKYAGSSNS